MIKTAKAHAIKLHAPDILLFSFLIALQIEVSYFRGEKRHRMKLFVVLILSAFALQVRKIFHV